MLLYPHDKDRKINLINKENAGNFQKILHLVST
nr:MAG TPA: hypothetical protein [Caudoviricetes sp.]